MSRHPVILNPMDKVSTAAGYIMEYRYRTLPIVDFEGRFLGIFSVNCLLRHILPKAVLMEKGLESVHFVRDSLKDLHDHYRKDKGGRGSFDRAFAASKLLRKHGVDFNTLSCVNRVT